MKLRTMICALAVAAVAPVFAGQTSSNICGWMKITSSLKNTVVGVPWVAVNGATTDAAVKVADLVKTDDLTAGDKLYYYNAGTWNSWTLTNGAWSPDATVSVSGVTGAAPADGQTIARGSALILSRQATAKPFYLYGQYSSTSVSQTLTAGSTSEPVYTLLASPKAEAFDLNGEGKITDVGASDTIVVPNDDGTSRVYKRGTLNGGTVWGYDVKKTVTWNNKTITQMTFTAAETIPAGTGFWYVSVGGAPTIKW